MATSDMLEIEYVEYYCKDNKHQFHTDGDRVSRLFLHYDTPGSLPDMSRFPQLMSIQLKGFALKEIPEDFFINNPELNYIYISWTYITELPEHLFRNQDRLKQLIIESAGFDHPKITSLPPNIFHPLIDLESVSLIHMGLESIDDDIFKMNSRLKNISMDHVKFTRLPSSILALEQLEKIDVPFDPVSNLIYPNGCLQHDAIEVLASIRQNEEIARISTKMYDKSEIEIRGKITGLSKHTIIKFLSYFRAEFEIEFRTEGITFLIPNYLEVNFDRSLFHSYSVNYFHRVKFHGKIFLSILQRVSEEFEINIYKEDQGHLIIEIADEKFVFEYIANRTKIPKKYLDRIAFNLVLDKDIFYKELQSLLAIGSGWLRMRYNFEKNWLTLIGKLGESRKWKYYHSTHNMVRDVGVLNRGKFPSETNELDLPIGLLGPLEDIRCDEIKMQVRDTRVRFYFRSEKISIDFRIDAIPDYNRHIKDIYPIVPVDEFADDIRDIFAKRPDVPLINNLSYLSMVELLEVIEKKNPMDQYGPIDLFLDEYPLTLDRKQKIAILEQVNIIEGKCKKCELKYRFNWDLCIYCQLMYGRESKILNDDYHIRAGEPDRLLLLRWGRDADNVEVSYIVNFWYILGEHDLLILGELGQGKYSFSK